MNELELLTDVVGVGTVDVVILDGEPTYLRVLSAALALPVRTTTSPLEMLHLCRLHAPRVVVLGVFLGGDVEGPDLIPSIQFIVPTAEIVVMTAFPDEERRARSLMLGAYDYVSKLDAHRLLAVIRAARARSQYVLPSDGGAPLYI